MRKRICIASILILLAAGGLFALRGFLLSAREAKLVRTEGAAHVLDQERGEKPVRENMNLYTGYSVRTETESFAWIDLDKTKLLKMDQQSGVTLVKEDRQMRLTLDDGSIFFCITKPLKETEDLILETSNLAMSIRGTTGIYRRISQQESQLVLLEGTVVLQNSQGAAQETVSTGQVADLYIQDSGEEKLTLRPAVAGDVPEYAMKMIRENPSVREKILSGGGKTDYMTEEELMALYGDLIRCLQEGLKGEPMKYSTVDYTRYLSELGSLRGYTENTDEAYSTFTHKPYHCDLWGFHVDNPEVLKGWSYAFHDLNADGIPEFLIADSNLASGHGIRDCWTSNGEKIMQLNWRPGADGCFHITANGCLIIDQCAPWQWYPSWAILEVAPDEPGNYYRCKAYIGIREIGWGVPEAWVVYDKPLGTRQVLFDNEQDFNAYIDENYPILPDTSFNWRPLS